MKNICFFINDITNTGGTERVSIMIANMLEDTGLFRVFSDFSSMDSKLALDFSGKRTNCRVFPFSPPWFPVSQAVFQGFPHWFPIVSTVFHIP